MSAEGGVGFSRRLSDGMVMRSPSSVEEVDRLAEFNAVVHKEPSVGELCRALLLNHPDVEREHWLYVEDEGKIVSSLCLIPWTFNLGGVLVKSGEMGLVGTLERYRHKGLIRRQVGRFNEILRQEGCHLSHIQGIPYFYRQFGYEYAVPLVRDFRIPFDVIPDGSNAEGEQAISFREATKMDIFALDRLYRDSCQGLTLYTARSKAVWEYLLSDSCETDYTADTICLTGRGKKPLGYFRILRKGFGNGLIVSEASQIPGPLAFSVLRLLAEYAKTRKKPYIKLELAESHGLVKAAQICGAQLHSAYAWQIRIVDNLGFLKLLRPLLEARWKQSDFRLTSARLRINTYMRSYLLEFKRGALARIEDIGFQEGGDVRIPPLLLVPLLLGYRDQHELMVSRHDLRVGEQARPLIDVLFPKFDSFLFTIY